MGHIHRVQVLDSFCYLFKQPPALRLMNFSLKGLLRVLLQRYSINIFSNEINLPGSIDKFIEPDNIGMV